MAIKTWFGRRASYSEAELVVMRALAEAVRRGDAAEIELRLIHELKAEFKGSRLK